MWAGLCCVRRGVKWSDIYVPLIGGNGYLIQFAVMAFLKPGFPYSFMMSKVLDLTNPRDKLVAAGYLSRIFAFIAEPLTNDKTIPLVMSDDEFNNKVAGYSEKFYHLKNQEDFVTSKCDYDDSLLHLLAVMKVLFANLDCRGNILFPICRRQMKNSFDLVFRKLTEYRIGLPTSETLRRNLFVAVKKVLQHIHDCKVTHLDFYPSNIMWKQVEGTEEEVNIMIIDWDSAHFVCEHLHTHVSRGYVS
jgi:hypothetical protein